MALGSPRKTEVVVRAPVMGIQRGDDDLRGENGKVRHDCYGEHTRRGEPRPAERERRRRGALMRWQAALRTRAVGQGFLCPLARQEEDTAHIGQSGRDTWRHDL
jgi:hypothetical protein